MKIPDRWEVGAATHTGMVRAANEDDYLVVAPLGDGGGFGLLIAVGDGMGGVAGGAEASRAAVRGLASELLRRAAEPAAEAMAAGYREACRRVHERSLEMRALREMGTTLTAVHLRADAAVLGHVGDSRCLRWREGRLSQLTVDHAVTGEEQYLTRCIGGGQEQEEVDVTEVGVHPGDVLVVMTDGVWTTVPEGALGRYLNRPAQAAAEALVRAAVDAGGPDNATAVVVRLHAGRGGSREISLPGHELESARPLPRAPGRLGAPRWLWPVVGIAVLVTAAAAVRWVTGRDLWELLASYFTS